MPARRQNSRDYLYLGLSVPGLSVSGLSIPGIKCTLGLSVPGLSVPGIKCTLGLSVLGLSVLGTKCRIIKLNYVLVILTVPIIWYSLKTKRKKV